MNSLVLQLKLVVVCTTIKNYGCKRYLSAILRPPFFSSWASAVYIKVSAASLAATLASCAALAASARSSSSTLSSSRREILAFRLSSRAFSVAETCWLYLFSHLAAVWFGRTEQQAFHVRFNLKGAKKRLLLQASCTYLTTPCVVAAAGEFTYYARRRAMFHMPILSLICAIRLKS